MRTPILLAAALAAGSAFAQPASKTIVVSSADGYGTTECLASGDRCGQVVADSLCTREGFPRAHRFGRAEDVTASIGGNSAGDHNFVVECGF
jgi:hypothetical protein